MARWLLPQLLFLAVTVMLAGCGNGGGDGSSSPPTASLVLEWNPNTESDLAGYKIYGATSSGGYGAANATVPANATSFRATGLQPGVTYFFVITAFDTAGNESARSSEVSAVASL